MNQEKIGKFIAECRKNKKLTQQEFAEKLNVSDKSISRWENGKTMMDISLFEPLCNELDITINELLTIIITVSSFLHTFPITWN